MLIRCVLSFALLAAPLAAHAVQTITLLPTQFRNIGVDNGSTDSFGNLTTQWQNGSANVGLLQFDLSSLQAGQRYTARLELFHRYNGASGAQFDLLLNETAWTAQSVQTWADRPDTSAFAAGHLNIDDSRQKVWRSIEINPLVVNWGAAFAQQFHGFTLVRTDASNPKAMFASNVEGLAPRLVVTSAVPEPSAYALMALGLALVGGVARRRAG